MRASTFVPFSLPVLSALVTLLYPFDYYYYYYCSLLRGLLDLLSMYCLLLHIFRFSSFNVAIVLHFLHTEMRELQTNGKASENLLASGSIAVLDFQSLILLVDLFLSGQVQRCSPPSFSHMLDS